MSKIKLWVILCGNNLEKNLRGTIWGKKLSNCLEKFLTSQHHKLKFIIRII